MDAPARPPLATYEDVAAMIEWPLLGPALTDSDVLHGLEAAKRYAAAYAVVRPCDIEMAVRSLGGGPVQPATVCGFPHGSQNTATKLYETRELLRRGAKQIEMVISIPKLLSRGFQYAQMEVLQFAELCHKEGARAGVILETASLSFELKIIGCRCCERAEVDVVADSTGFGPGCGTAEDWKLLRKYLPEEVAVKASGVGSLDAALEAYEAGCSHIGTDAAAAILDEWKGRLARTAGATS
jgi:deoxyribose-phosphate aldolase